MEQVYGSGSVAKSHSSISGVQHWASEQVYGLGSVARSHSSISGVQHRASWVTTSLSASRRARATTHMQEQLVSCYDYYHAQWSA